MTPLVREHLRCTLLRALNESAGYKSNSSLLTDRARAFALEVTRDNVHTELHWLAEQGLLELNELGDVLIAELTTRGQDTVAGRTTVPGVKRPGPR